MVDILFVTFARCRFVFVLESGRGGRRAIPERFPPLASISTDANGNRRIIFTNCDGKRTPIYVGKLRMRDTETIANKIEALLSAKSSRRPMEPDLAVWVAYAPDWLAMKLAANGLIAPRVMSGVQSTLLGEFIDAYLAGRTDIKPRTQINFRQVRRDLVAHFGETNPLPDVTPGDADEWRRWLLTKLGDNTVRRHCGRAKQLFRAALRKRLISENPFADMKGCAVQANKSREFFISRDAAEKVLAMCPDLEWRLIFALARFGGLRTPSETLLLRWGDVDWERGRMIVTSPKTAHHEGKGSRVVPLFPELRPHLEAAFDQAEPGTEFVIARRRDGNVNWRTQLERIIHKAGLTTWPKLFQNLRSTRETELTETFPLHAVTTWLGNSQAIAAKHYLQVTDAHFEKATRIPTRAPAEMVENVAKAVIRPLRENEKAPAFPGLSVPFRIMHGTAVPPTGVELSQESPGKLKVAEQGDSLSDSLCGISDSRLTRLIEVWSSLSGDTRDAILTLAGCDSTTLTTSTT